MSGKILFGAVVVSVLACGQGAFTAQDHAGRAADFVQSGDLKSAEAELRKAVELSPRDPALLTSLGGVLAMEGKLAPANVYLRDAARFDPRNPALRRNLAANEWQLGRFAEARRNLELLIRENPEDRVAIFLLGMVAENQKDYARSAELLESVPDVARARPEAEVALASSYYHIGRAEKARAALQELLSRHVDPRVMFQAGMVAMAAGDFRTAESMLSPIRSSYSDPAAVELQLALAQCRRLIKEGALPRALETAANAARAFPGSYEILLTKASIESSLQYFTDAVADYSGVVKVKPDLAEAARGLAVAEWRAGMKKEAAAIFERAIRQFPRDAPTFQEYGALLLEQGTPESAGRAVRLLKTAIALDGSLAEPRYQLANAELAAGRPEQALQYLETAAKRDPGSGKIHYAMSRAYRRLGRSTDADKELDIYRRLKAAEQPAHSSYSALGMGRNQ